MPINTEGKRKGAAGAGIPGQTLPKPDGTVDAGDRAHVAGIYPGIAPGAPASGLPGKKVYGDGLCFTFK